MLLLNPRFSGPEWRSFRLGCFVGTGLTAFAPIAHALVLWGPTYVCGIGVPYYLLEGLFLIIGCYFWEVGSTPIIKRDMANLNRGESRNVYIQGDLISGVIRIRFGMCLLRCRLALISVDC